MAKINPIIDPKRPACDTALGVEMNDMPMYILVMFAAVKYHFDVLFYFSS